MLQKVVREPAAGVAAEWGEFEGSVGGGNGRLSKIRY